MNTFINTFLTLIGVRTTTERAIAGITKAIANLEAVADRHDAEALTALDKLDAAHTARDAAVSKAELRLEKEQGKLKAAYRASDEAADRARGIVFRLDGLING